MKNGGIELTCIYIREYFFFVCENLENVATFYENL